MRLTSLLFSSKARVYNLRLLILVNVGSLVAQLVWTHQSLEANPSDEREFIDKHRLNYSAPFAIPGFVLVHHTLAVFPSRMRLACVDWAATLIEIVAVGYFMWDPLEYLIFPLAPLALTIIFRTATIWWSPDRFWRQKLNFLGGCTSANPPYKPWSILLNRSIARPLLRGESCGIINLRGFMLGGILLGVPIFAFFSILVNPHQSQVFVRELPGYWDHRGPIFPQNPIIKFDPLYPEITAQTVYNTTMNVTADSRNGTVNCEAMPPAADPRLTGLKCDGEDECKVMRGPVVECSLSWVQITSITITIEFPAQDPPKVVHVIAGQGDIRYLLQLTDPIPVPPGYDLWAYVTWTRRQAFQFGQGWWSSRLVDVLILEVDTLLPTKQLANNSPVSSTLTIVQRESHPTKHLQEYTSASMIDGISAAGGFWTFVNGTFILLFGANIMYFTFRSRPLSALGIMHYFQRRTLLRQWREDFPALHTEGGQPGSTSAGIVAFIRERLVDLGDEEGEVPEQEHDTTAVREPVDPELGRSSFQNDTCGTESRRSESNGPGWDEIPLLDMDPGAETKNEKSMHDL